MYARGIHSKQAEQMNGMAWQGKAWNGMDNQILQEQKETKRKTRNYFEERSLTKEIYRVVKGGKPNQNQKPSQTKHTRSQCGASAMKSERKTMSTIR